MTSGGDQGGVRPRCAPARSSHALEEAARSRSEADWIVGMNATRAATIRLRSSFDGAVSLGRVQTPTLAIVARREEEIRAFKPEPYWLVDAIVRADSGEPAPLRRAASTPARKPRLADRRRRPRRSSPPSAASAGEITKLEKTTQRKERAPLLYDLTSLQREANTRYGFSARRTLAAAQRLTRSTRRSRTRARTRASCRATWSREIKPTAELVGRAARVRAGARAVRHRARRAAARRAWSTTRRSPTTTRSSRRAPSTSSTR